MFSRFVTRIGRCWTVVVQSTTGISLKDWSEIAKNAAQVTALIVAGFWTYEMFVRKEAPTLLRHATSGAQFDWETGNAEGCLGSYYVTLTNDGIKDFDVRQVRVKMWEFETPSGTGGADFVDLDSVRRQKPIFERLYEDGAFVRHFPPGHGRSERYAWFFKRQPKRNVYLTVEFFTDLGSASPEWSQYYWWEVCGAK